MSETEYVLGHSAREMQRLMLEATLLRPITERLLRGAGIGQGLRVLDLGCGAGDVSMLAAELVGPSGSVVGIDRNQDLIAVARDRARTAKLRHVDFEEVAFEAFSDSEPFDAVIGRDVLVHQADPVALIRAAAGRVRLGGVLAFHEPGLSAPVFRSLPRVSLWQQVGEWIQAAFQAAAPHFDAAGRLIEHYSRAGLPRPTLFCEALVGGGEDSPLYALAANLLKSVLPQLVRRGIVSEEAVAIETLEARLRDAVVEAQSQIVGLLQFCAWTRVEAIRSRRRDVEASVLREPEVRGWLRCDHAAAPLAMTNPGVPPPCDFQTWRSLHAPGRFGARRIVYA